MKIYRAETGQRVNLRNVEIDSLETLRDYLHTYTSVPSSQQILMTSSGQQLKPEHLPQLLVQPTSESDPQEPILFLYDRAYLDPTESEQESFVNMESPVIEPAPRGPMSMQGALANARRGRTGGNVGVSEQIEIYMEVFKNNAQLAQTYASSAQAYASMAGELVSQIKVQAVAIQVALLNLDAHVGAAGGAWSAFEGIAKREIGKCGAALSAEEAATEAVRSLIISPGVTERIVGNENRAVRLGEYLDLEGAMDERKIEREEWENLGIRIKEQEESLDDIKAGAEELRKALFGDFDLKSIDVTLTEARDIYTKILTLRDVVQRDLTRVQKVTTDLLATIQPSTSPSHIPSQARKQFEAFDNLLPIHFDDYLPKLHNFATQTQQLAVSLASRKRDATFALFRRMTAVSRLQSRIANVVPSLGNLEKIIRALRRRVEGAREDSEIGIRRALGSYGALLTEIVRRREYARVILENAGVLAEVFAMIGDAERKRRENFRGDAGRSLIFEIDGLEGEVVPVVEVTARGVEQPRGVAEITDSEIWAVFEALRRGVDVVGDDRWIALVGKMIRQVEGLRNEFARALERRYFSDRSSSISSRRSSRNVENDILSSVQTLNTSPNTTNVFTAAGSSNNDINTTTLGTPSIRVSPSPSRRHTPRHGLELTDVDQILFQKSQVLGEQEDQIRKYEDRIRVLEEALQKSYRSRGSERNLTSERLPGDKVDGSAVLVGDGLGSASGSNNSGSGSNSNSGVGPNNAISDVDRINSSSSSDQLTSKAARIEQLEQLISSKDSELTQMRGRLQATEAQQQRLQGELGAASDKAVELEAALAAELRRKEEGWKDRERIAELEQMYEELRQQNIALEAEFDDERAHNEELRKSLLREVQTQAQLAEKRVTDTESTWEGRYHELEEESKAKIASLEQDFRDADQLLVKKQRSWDQERQKLADQARESTEAGERKVEETERVLEGVRVQLRGAEGRLDEHDSEWRERLTNLKTAHAEAMRAREMEYTNLMNKREEEVTSLKAKLFKSEKDNEKLSAHQEQARAMIDATAESFDRVKDEAKVFKDEVASMISVLREILKMLGEKMGTEVENPTGVDIAEKVRECVESIMMERERKKVDAENDQERIKELEAKADTVTTETSQAFDQYRAVISKLLDELGLRTEEDSGKVLGAEEIVSRIKRKVKEYRSFKEKYRMLKEEAQEKIAFHNFKQGDLALFLPTRNPTGIPFAAFNVNTPHYFLKPTSSAQQTQKKEYILGRIISMEEKIVDNRNADGNPYSLENGIKYYQLEVENWNPKSLRSSQQRHRSGLADSRRLSTNLSSSMVISTPPPVSPPPFSPSDSPSVADVPPRSTSMDAGGRPVTSPRRTGSAGATRNVSSMPGPTSPTRLSDDILWTTPGP